MKTRTKLIINIGILVGIALSLALFLVYTSSRFYYPLEPSETTTGADRKKKAKKALGGEVSSLSAVDRLLEKMELGNIAFNAPQSMNLYDTAIIQLVLGVETPIEELKRLVEAEGEKVGAQIRIADRMEARLSGPDFAITAITPETQAVARTEVTQWKWEVKPQSAGRHFLHLTLSAILVLEGVATPRAIRTFDKVIEVEVTLNQRITGFLKNNWQWLWAVILVPLAGWVWKRRRALLKRTGR